MFGFSLVMGFAAGVLTLTVYIALASRSIGRWKETNLRTLEEVNCEGATCDTKKFIADVESDGANYVLDMQTRYFIAFPSPTTEEPGRFPPLDHFKTSFIVRFRQPMSYKTPDGEVWRLYSQQASVDNETVEIIVGSRLKGPSVIETPNSQIAIVDASLRRDIGQIASSLRGQKTSKAGRSVLTSDGFAVVEANSGRVERRDAWLPEFLPETTEIPAPGWKPFAYDGDLYVLQTNVKGNVLAASVIQIGGLWWIGGSFVIAFLLAVVGTHMLGRTFLRMYFATSTMRVPTLDEALRTGEGQSIEFKRGLSEAETRSGNAEQEILKSIAAFANSNDGVIFVGVDDAGHVKGLGLDYSAKDRMERKIRQLVRSTIRPTPPLQLTFEDHRGLVILRIVVARGEEPVYLLNGAIYVRYGSSDVQAQPEDLRRLVSEYAL